METNYKRTVAGSVGAGMGAIFNGSGRKYFILEHKTESKYHHVGESQKIIIDQIELGRDSSCQVRFGDDCPTVSHKHAAIVKDGEGWKLIHLSQTNNTYVNGQPVAGECPLNSGDEIRLSSNGPVLGFIVPQGAKSVVSSIGLTERMNLFRKQALKPYKTALTILSLILLLAIGGLVFTNKNLKTLEKEHTALVNEKGDIERQMDSLDKAMVMMADKSSQEYKDLESKYQAAQRRSIQAEARMRETERRIEKRDKEAAEQARKVAEEASSKEMNEGKVAEETSSENEAPSVAEAGSGASEPVLFSSIYDCDKYVFYVRMDNLAVYNPDGGLVAQFETSGIVGGTGFLLENGIFATACRVVEPWFYFKGKIGEDQKGRNWSFEDIQTLANYGYRIVANYTATSSEYSFHFKNTDVRSRADLKFDAEVFTYAEYNIENKTVRQLINRHDVDLYWHSSYAAADWATFRPSRIADGGLVFDNYRSLNPEVENVKIIGFPRREGYVDSQSITPIIKDNRINTPTLNKHGIIELASETYVIGNDGGPVLVQIDGVWTVVGLLSHADGNGRDYVVPISYINN